MTAGLAFGAAVVAGAPPWYLALMGLGCLDPRLGLAATALVALRRTSVAGQPSFEAAFCLAMAAEVRAGANLRSALARASQELREGSHLARLCEVGAPIDELAVEIEALLPEVGLAAAGAVRIGGLSGGAMAGAFEAIAVLAADEAELQRERAVAAAQARLSANVISAVPVLGFGLLAATGRLGVLASGGPVGHAFLGIGGLLMVTGLAVMRNLGGTPA